MNKNHAIHLERKEHWRALIKQCDASGQTQQDWCKENQVCNASLSRWRNQIWREEEAEKEFAAAREERSFVEITPKLYNKENNDGGKAVEATTTCEKRVTIRQPEPVRAEATEPRLIKPDAIIGYHEYTIGVYEDTTEQLLRKVMEVLRYA